MPEKSFNSDLTSKNKIRLLEVWASKDSQHVTFRLKHVALDESPKYEALSYEWKTHEGYDQIRCEFSKISVTRNLLAALNALRYPNESRWLWVDAICINQNDKAEKAKQISIMRDIYAKATSVIVWLG
jgi:hypothetical protein